MLNLVINTMTLSDLEDIKNSLPTDFDDFWSENIFREELQNKNSTYIAARLDKKIVGYAGMWKSVDDIHITNIVVHKNYRQQGIGSKLLEQLISFAKQQDVQALTLEVQENNLAALHLYQKYNFKILGQRKNYYKDKAAIIMTLFFHEINL